VEKEIAEIEIKRPGFWRSKCLVKISIDLSAGVPDEKLDEFVLWVANHANQIARYCVGEVHCNNVAQTAIDKAMNNMNAGNDIQLL